MPLKSRKPRRLPNLKSSHSPARFAAYIEALETRQLMTSTFAVGIGINDGSTSFMNVAIPKLKSLGVQTVRIYYSTNFSNGNTSSGVLKRAIDYHNAGFDVMLEVCPDNGSVPSYGSVQNFFNWAMGTALKGAVNRWEIGNEPDHSTYWKGSLSQYVTGLLKPAYEVLHAAGEEVVSAGPSWNTQDVQTMINAGMLGYTDYVGYHPYATGVTMVRQRLAEIKAVVQGRKPLVASEWNVRGLEGNPAAWAAADADIYSDIASTFAINYYYAAEKSGTLAGPAGIMNSDCSPNTPFWNAFATFQTGGTDVGNVPAGGNATIAGNVFNDTNGNGAQDFNEVSSGVRTVFLDTNGNGTLDTGEASIQSAADGTFKFINLPAGTYNVTSIFPPGYHISGTSTKDKVVVVAPAQQVAGVVIGAAANVVVPPVIVVPPPIITPPQVVPLPPVTTGSIAGIVFNDTNGNGIMDAVDGPTGVRTLFLDTNANGIFDAGEQSTQSAIDGTYKFANLAAGTYNVCRIFPAGYHLSNSSAKDVQVAVNLGQVVTGINVGTTNKIVTS